MVYVAFSTLCFALVALPLVWAQFPAVCNTQTSLSTKTCCPDNCGSRGTCVSIREEVERSWESANQTIVALLRGMPGWPQDIRYQWPLKIFERVCNCDEGWRGYDCSQCDFGFIANEADECVKCNTSQLLFRRNFVDLSKQEQLNFMKLLEEAKNQEEKEWAAIISVPDETNGYYNLKNVTTYDMFTFTHMLSGREKENEYCSPVLMPYATVGVESYWQFILFAHFGSTFPPWHRYFIMQMESELRQIGNRMGISDFTLPYWDWTPTSNCLTFTGELFGAPEYSDEFVNVSGTLFENGKWPPVCDKVYRLGAGETDRNQFYANATICAEEKILCNIEDDRMANRRLQHGAWREENLQMPDYKLIAMTLRADQLDGTYGFSNRLEGVIAQCAGETEKCMSQSIGGFNMHGLMHNYVGGQMSVGGPSTNDPIFYVFHSNIDRIFERWLQKYNGTPPSYQPVDGGNPGHNLNDYLVPTFPLRTNADFYKESKELGYIYDDLPWDIPSTDYQLGCPSEQCDKGGYPPTVFVNTTSAYCAKLRMGQKSIGQVYN